MNAITVARTRDIDLVSSLLAQAFADDPVINWMAPDRRRHRLLFRTLLKHAHGRSDGLDIAVRDGNAVGAAVWDPPGYRQSTRDQIAALPGFFRALGTRMRYGAALEEEFAAARPDGSFWYLAQLGAPARGLGVGSALLHARLDGMDAPAYLESSHEANIPLYERFGFSVIDEIVLPFDGPRCWPMYRPGAQSPRA